MPVDSTHGAKPASQGEVSPTCRTWLDSHINYESANSRRFGPPTLERITELVKLMGDPQKTYPVIQVTGTNGKGSTTRLITELLLAHGLSVGTYTSPHLERVNERMAYCGAPIDDDELDEVLSALRSLEPLMSGIPTWFELVTAAALRWFADRAVDVAVLEVGLGGRWDATNVADATVAVVTNVELDHMELLGPTRTHIAREKAGVVGPMSTLVLGETDPELLGVFTERSPVELILRDRDFGVGSNHVAHGGRLLDLWTPGGSYPETFLPLYGAHQAINAACSLAAVQSFFGRPSRREVIQEAFSNVTVAGRLEVLARHPLCLVDGAHNPAGLLALGRSLDEDFALVSPSSERVKPVVVMGMLAGRDATKMLQALGTDHIKMLFACQPGSPRAFPAVALAQRALALGIPTEAIPDPKEAVTRARVVAGEDGMVLVTGSLYLVAEARAAIG
ncbi:MAG: bifunctional folylpolyglutamate synthase/dihydrofolate synthase [Actinobacteria bacterium]|nr:bifunctional folylpolyglutamate synthase/dihydrofolate synthase [Actinomycetota bacterium]